MQRVTVQQARKDMSRLLDAVVSGDQVLITRRNKPVAILSSITPNSSREETVRFPDRTPFRKHLPAAKASSVQLIRQIRDEK